MTEIEAKFIVRRPEQVGEALRVLSANGYAVEDHGTAIHADGYFDTEDWSILAAGWACRVRRRDGEAKLTIKSLHGPDGSVFVREEISHALPDEDAQPSNLPPGPVLDRLGSIAGNKRSATRVIDDGEYINVTVDTLGGSAWCHASESVQDSGVEATNDCGARYINAGGSDSCTFVNTVFFEGIPTLSQYGLAIMALLMLGMGFVGMRRFV